MEKRRLWRMWGSGLLALVTAAHLLRALTGVQVVIGTIRIPVWVSWIVFPVAGFFSGWLMRLALEGQEAVSSKSAAEAGGCLQNETNESSEPHVCQERCGVLVGHHLVGEDDEAS